MKEGGKLIRIFKPQISGAHYEMKTKETYLPKWSIILIFFHDYDGTVWHKRQRNKYIFHCHNQSIRNWIMNIHIQPDYNIIIL